jgi:hypothetical protein
MPTRVGEMATLAETLGNSRRAGLPTGKNAQSL